jgi:internalin A
MSFEPPQESSNSSAEALIEKEMRLRTGELVLSGLRLTSLPESLERLTSLRVLRLSGNQLRSLSEPLGQLTSLESLDLGTNHFTSLPESLGQLINLQSLNVSANQLATLPWSLGKLNRLKNLNVSGNQLRSLPEWLRQLINLQSLDVANNHLRKLPEWIGQLTDLRSLSVSGNRFTSLPPEIRELRLLNQLFLHANPALGLPVEVLGPTEYDISRGLGKETSNAAAILDYYFRIHPPESDGGRAGRLLRELKVIFVGPGEVGKSSLIEVLKGGEFIEGMKKTEGIAITRWPLVLSDGEATALVWDFGGQEIMHGTHQFFLTHRSLYVVVVEGRHDRAKQDAEYWLKMIRAFGGQSPTLVVMSAQRRHAFDIDREYLATKYHVAREHFFRTDCADEESVRRLHKAIEQQAAKMLTPDEFFPGEWWETKQRLAAMKDHGEDCLSEEAYENLCKELNVKEKDTKNLLDRLTELGTVVSFPDLRLRELTVLNPEWVTDGVYRVLNNAPLREQRHGQLAWHDLKRILPSDRWPEKRHRYLVELMRKFEISFPLEGEQETELVPELLPDTTPPLKNWEPSESLVFIYQYPVLPHGLLPRFITRTHPKSRGCERWRSGVVLAREEAEAVVRADYDKNQVIVWVRGPHAMGRRELLTVVRDHFAIIHGRIKELNPQELVTMPGYPEVTVPFDDLIKDEQESRLTIRLTVNGKRMDLKIAELLSGVKSPDEREGRASQKKERLGGRETIIYHQPTIMGDHIEQHFSGTFQGPVAAVMRDCTSIIANQPPGERKELLKTLQEQIGNLISELPDEKQQFKETLADRLKEVTKGVTSVNPDRAWYSVSSKGLLEAAKFVKDFSGEIAGTLKNLGRCFWPDFTLPGN